MTLEVVVLSLPWWSDLDLLEAKTWLLDQVNAARSLVSPELLGRLAGIPEFLAGPEGGKWWQQGAPVNLDLVMGLIAQEDWKTVETVLPQTPIPQSLLAALARANQVDILRRLATSPDNVGWRMPDSTHGKPRKLCFTLYVAREAARAGALETVQWLEQTFPDQRFLASPNVSAAGLSSGRSREFYDWLVGLDKLQGGDPNVLAGALQGQDPFVVAQVTEAWFQKGAPVNMDLIEAAITYDCRPVIDEAWRKRLLGATTFCYQVAKRTGNTFVLQRMGQLGHVQCQCSDPETKCPVLTYHTSLHEAFFPKHWPHSVWQALCKHQKLDVLEQAWQANAAVVKEKTDVLCEVAGQVNQACLYDWLQRRKCWNLKYVLLGLIATGQTWPDPLPDTAWLSVLPELLLQADVAAYRPIIARVLPLCLASGTWDYLQLLDNALTNDCNEHPVRLLLTHCESELNAMLGRDKISTLLTVPSSLPVKPAWRQLVPSASLQEMETLLSVAIRANQATLVRWIFHFHPDVPITHATALLALNHDNPIPLMEVLQEHAPACLRTMFNGRDMYCNMIVFHWYRECVFWQGRGPPMPN